MTALIAKYNVNPELYNILLQEMSNNPNEHHQTPYNELYIKYSPNEYLTSQQIKFFS